MIPLGFAFDRRARRVLIDARLAAKLTQHELAARLERMQSFVSRIEQGPLAVDRTHFVAIARALGADPHELFAKAISEAAETAATQRARTRRR